MRSLVTCLAVWLCAVPGVRADKKLDDAIRKAELQLAKGKEADAVKILQKEATRLPRDPEPQLLLAALQMKLGKPDEAKAAFAKAGELAATAPAPVRARVLAYQSAFALRTGQAGDALRFAREGVEASATPEAMAALARAEARLGLPSARATAERATAAAPGGAVPELASGDALLAARLGGEAEAAYRRALKADPRSVSASAGVALALAAQGKASDALAAAQAAVKIDARSAEAQVSLVAAELARDPEDKKSEAVAAAYQAVTLEPTSAFAKQALARALESGGQLDQALAAYGETAQLDPSWPAPQIGALRVKLAKGDAAGALAGLRALPAEATASGEAQLLLGRILSKQDDWPSALPALDRAAEALPGFAEAHALRAVAAHNNGELKTAADAAGRASALDPGNAAYLSRHALYLGYDRRLDDALGVMEKATARPDGQTADVFVALGDLNREFRPPRVADAVAAYEKAKALDPKNSRAALGVPLSYRAGRQWAKAISAYERVSQSLPRLDAEASLGIAWCYLRSGDETKARFYTQVAARGGADVEDIRRALSGGAGAGEHVELGEQLRSRHAGEQARAAKELLEIGSPGVPALAAALERKTTAIAVREAIVEGLGALGPAARGALPQLERLAKTPARGQTSGESAAVAALREREARLAVAARAAVARIRG
jgi:tetratricopeptide (TPR) repeat protein